MKNTIHKPNVRIVTSILESVFNQGRYADKCIEFEFKNNKQLGSHDRAFIAETSYEIIRYYRLYAFISNTDTNYWHMIIAYFMHKQIAIPSWMEWDGISIEEFKQRFKEAQSHRVIKESIPDWLEELGQHELKSQWPDIIHFLNKPAHAIIRINTLKLTKQLLIKQLSEQKIEYELIDNYPEAIIIKKKNIYQSQFFKDGYFEVQDASSQLVAPFVDCKAGMRVIDACAGAGGKSLHLAAIMNNKGQIISLDTESWKLEELKKRARRNGINIIETRAITNSKVVKRLQESCDRLLLDVPCSGLGVLRRNPDAKWKLNLDSINKVKKIQYDILQEYSKMLKSGGKMVYATCSILPSENQDQVSLFLKENKNFTMEEEKIITPSQSTFDGFYMARMVKH